MPRDSMLLQAIKLLGQRLAVLHKFYGKVACLNPEEREILGYCYAYMSLFGENDPLSKDLKDKIIPALEKIGMARWPRTELTDLALKIADKDEEQVTLVPMEEEEEIRQ